MPDPQQSQQTLAQLVRAKYPGAYDDMDDVTLEKNVLAKYPQYGDLPRSATAQTNPEQYASAQAAAQTKRVVSDVSKNMRPSFWGGAPMNPKQEQYVNQRLPLVKPYTQATAAIGGAGLGSIAAGAAKLGEGLPWFLRTMAGASSSGFGAGAGSLAAGASPVQALDTAASYTGAALPFEGAGQALATPQIKNTIAAKLRNPATARQSQLGRPGSVKSYLPPFLQKWTVPEEMIPKGEVGTPTNPGPYSEIPSKLTKAQIAASPEPFTGQPKLPAPSGPTGSAAEPFEPLVWESPEEAAAHDLRMQNLKRQASSAGTYHAAQGGAGKRTNLQQRIQRKSLPFLPQ